MNMKKTLLATALVTASSAALALPNIEVLATGGTIAGAGQSATGTAYTSAKVSVNHLVAAVPALANIANITPKQVVQIGSQDMTDDVWLKLVKTINQDCKKYDGFVVTHGTDTMEETSYFVHLAAKCNKPIVFVGAMLPSTGLSADGPKNLYNAVVVASDKGAQGKGVLVAMDDKVIGARDVIKHNTTMVETFQGANFGTMGAIFNSKVHWANTPVQKHTVDTEFDVSKLESLPKVGIVYNYANVPVEPLEALLKAGYKGIVTAGVGNGNIHKNLFPTLEKAVKDGVAVVRSSRVATGSATKDGEINDAQYGFVAGQFLNPQKARVLLQLALTKTSDPKKIQEYFDKY